MIEELLKRGAKIQAFDPEAMENVKERIGEVREREVGILLLLPNLTLYVFTADMKPNWTKKSANIIHSAEEEVELL